MANFNDIAARFLGQKSSYPLLPDKSLLQPLPRSLARAGYNIQGNEFVGYDIWHVYEATFLISNGLPISGMLKIVYSSDSPNIVESKSLKLYLNAFDMQIMGSNVEEGIANYETRIKDDLIDCIGFNVKVKFFENPQFDSNKHNDFFQSYKDLYKYLEQSGKLYHMDWNNLNPNINYLQWHENPETYSYAFSTHILRTRCRVTKQKDSGHAFFQFQTKGAYLLPESLLKNIIAIRETEEFHEFCAEKLFIQLKQCPFLTQATVSLFFARRGAIDINPIRATDINLLPKSLIDPGQYSPRTPMQ